MDQSLRDQLHLQGFVSVGPVLSRSEARALSIAFHQWLGDQPETNDYGLLRNDVWREVVPFQDELQRGRLGRLACALLETDEVVLFQDNVIEKPAQHPLDVQWHQDYSYWPLDRPMGITLWVALSPANEQNGCLHYMPGTHLLGERQATDFMPGASQVMAPHLTALTVTDLSKAVPCPLSPGEVLAHHPLTWHMSPPNSTTRSRCGWSLTFLHPETRWNPAHAPHPLNHQLQPKPWSPLCTERFPRTQIGEA